MLDRRPLIAFIAAGTVLIAAMAVWMYFGVEEVSVTGNTRYTDEQIEDMILTGPLGHNSVYLYLKYNDKPIFTCYSGQWKKQDQRSGKERQC